MGFIFKIYEQKYFLTSYLSGDGILLASSRRKLAKFFVMSRWNSHHLDFKILNNYPATTSFFCNYLLNFLIDNICFAVNSVATLKPTTRLIQYLTKPLNEAWMWASESPTLSITSPKLMILLTEESIVNYIPWFLIL